MYLRRSALMCLIVALLIGTGTAYAGITGVIAGRISDNDGNPVPGVTVTVNGENLPGSRIDVTSASGTFRMPELPPGIYEIVAELMGMKTIRMTNVKVAVNQTTSNKLTMEIAPFEDEIVVVGKADVLDVKAATMKATIERDVTERLPGSDDLFSAFSMAGGITGGGNVRVHGGADTDNVYLFDGVDTTDPVTSTFGANLNNDAIEEVEVQTGGFQAEYGRSMGGIVNAVTKSGGNDFHGIFRVKYVDTGWAADDDHEDAGTVEFEYFEPTLTLEGPIIRDKLWFMVSYNYFNQESTTQTLGFYGADSEDPDDLVGINTDREFHLPYVKLTFQPNQEHKFVVNYSGEDGTLNNSTGDPDFNTPEVFNTQEQGGPFYSLEWTWLKSASMYFIARVGASLGTLNNIPTKQTGTDPREAGFSDTFYGMGYNNSESWTEEDRDRFQASVTGSYFLDDLMGSHEFKSGLEYHEFSRESYSERPGGASYTIDPEPHNGDNDNPDYFIGTSATRELFLNPGTATESGDYLAYYIQDDWAVTDNITLNLGLRYEWIEFENDLGDSEVPAWTWGNFAADTYTNTDGNYNQTAPMKFDDMLAPRIGFNWDVFGNGKTAVHAFYGRFFNPFDLSLPNMFQPFSADQNATKDQNYIGPQWTDADSDGIPDEDFFFADENWETTAETEPGDWNLIDPDLEAEYTDEIMIGVEQEVIENFSLGMTYTYRETNDMVEDTGIFVDDDGNIVWTYLGAVKDDFSGLDPDRTFDPRHNIDYSKHLYYVTNAEGNHRKYYGLEVNARARQDNWDLQGSYTYAKAEGAVIEGQEDFDGSQQFSGQFDSPGTTDNLYGELPWSCRHYVKLAGSYHFDITDWYEMSFGVNAFWRSGYHYSMRSKPPWTYDPDETDPEKINDINDPSTWSGRPPYRDRNWHFREPRGGHELPSYYNVDFSFQNTFKFGRYGSATVIFDVENLTDNQGIVSESEIYNPNKPYLFGNADGYGPPRNYRLSLKYAF